MRLPIKFWLAALCILVLAAGLRIWMLDIRPMHGDEAVHAYKFGELLEKNYYRYDTSEFHGPTLNYFTLVPAWLAGKHTYVSLTESILRSVPVFFGLLLVVMPLFLSGGLGRPASIIASAFIAISPAFVFYSRYYIQEMLLACFTFGLILAGYKYAKSGKLIWAIQAGLFAGLCYATKETCIIAFGSMIFALLLTLLIHRRSVIFQKIKILHITAAVVVAIAISCLFFSSFFSNPSGIIDSLKAFTGYFHQAGNNPLHIHPWYYYLQILLYSKAPSGPFWTEGFIVIMACIGIVLIIKRKGIAGLDVHLLDFLIFYTLIMTIIYSAIPYKTPWCLLSFYNGMILLAAVGVIAIMNLIGRFLARIVLTIFFIVVSTDLCMQAFLASFISYCDTSNPYVYAQPTRDVLKIAPMIERISKAYPVSNELPISIICTKSDYWPLPWYLRSFKNVGWYNDVNEIKTVAPVVIASSELQDRLINRLFEISPPGQKNLYVSLYESDIELRHGIELRGYITKDLLDQYQQLETNTQPANKP